jgi:hypothetical protein
MDVSTGIERHLHCELSCFRDPGLVSGGCIVCSLQEDALRWPAPGKPRLEAFESNMPSFHAWVCCKYSRCAS